ncbi:hypothetical protein SPFM9_00132 [Salmonella phage SPFM9]|nr:hypothetical protein SPFM9_00132 [Salmonella phage SPFM9]
MFANGYDNATPWYYRSAGVVRRFGDLPTRSGGSPTDSGGYFQDGEWHNTFASLFRYYVVRLPRLGDYSYGHSTYLSPPRSVSTTNQRRTFNKDGYETTWNEQYQQGLAWGTDDYGFHKFVFKGRILFIPDTVTRLGHAELNGLIGFNAWNQAPTLFRGDWHRGYFGTLTNEEFILNGLPIVQGDFPMTGPGPQELIEAYKTYQYRIVAVKGTEKVMPGEPIVTLPGNTTTYEDKTTLDSIEIYRYDNPRQSVNPVAELVE